MNQLKAVNKQDPYRGAIADSTNYELEAALVGVPLWLQREGHEQDAASVAHFITRVPRDTFVRHTHRVLWDVYLGLTTRELPLTVAWIQQVASEAGEWSDNEADGGFVTPGQLDELADKGTCKLTIGVGDSPLSLAREAAAELAVLRRRRLVIHASEDFHDRLTKWHAGNEQDVGGALDELVRLFNERPAHEETIRSLGQLVREDIRTLEAQRLGEIPERLLSGFDSIEAVLGGFLPGDLLTVAGRTGMGKSSLALSIAVNIAKDGHLCLYLTLEMRSNEHSRRFLSRECRINTLTMRAGDLSEWQMDTVTSQFRDGSPIPLFFDESNFVPAELEAKIKDLNRKAHPACVEFVVIDHIGLVGRNDLKKYDRYDLRLGSYTSALKDLSKRLNLTTLMLCQLNRMSAQEQRPARLADLRNSGSIEEDSDIVAGIYRKFVDTKLQADEPHAELHILKNRSGRVGKVNLVWHPALAMFTDPSSGNEQHGDAEAHLDSI